MSTRGKGTEAMKTKPERYVMLCKLMHLSSEMLERKRVQRQAADLWEEMTPKELEEADKLFDDEGHL